MESDWPQVTVVIPVYNEEAILEKSVTGLISQLDDAGMFSYDLLLCENGSFDKTREIGAELCARYRNVQMESLSVASYGAAMRHGIEHAHGEYVAVFNVDLWNVHFLAQALVQLRDHDMVIGSKSARGARDKRPWLRRAITRSFNLLLRIFFHFRGTDTHGLKVFKRVAILPVVRACVTNNEIFDTEFVLRAQRQGLCIIETPVDVEEMRPSRYGLWIRVPKTVRDLIQLAGALRIS